MIWIVMNSKNKEFDLPVFYLYIYSFFCIILLGIAFSIQPRNLCTPDMNRTKGVKDVQGNGMTQPLH